jgi:hypothetical protein
MTLGITEGASMGVAMVVTIGAWWIFSRTSGLRQRKGKKDAARKDAAEKLPDREGGNAMPGRRVVGTEGGPAARARAIGQDGSASDTGTPTASRGEEALVAETSQSSGLCGLLKLTSRYNGITHILERRNGRQKLTATEEQTIVPYMLDLDSRGFAPRLCEVEDIADKLLAVRGSELVGKHWAERFVTRSAELKMAFNRAKDRQRIL